jgi:ArsR family transcriptional regulator
MRDRLESTKCARYLKALAEPERLKIIQCLQTGPKNVGQLANLLDEEVANVSHHLGVLRHAGLVLNRKEGKYVVYDLHPDIYVPQEEGPAGGVLDLGCCRLELGRR